MAPQFVEAGRHFVIELWVAPSGQHEALLAQAMRPGKMVERAHRAYLDLAKDQVLTAILKLPEFDVDEPIEHLGWNGDIRNIGFMVRAPRELKPGSYPGAIKLLQGQTPFASVWFDLQVAADDAHMPSAPAPAATKIQRITRAFASYASEDRAEVLRRVQGMNAAGVDIFLDIVNLRAGQQWEAALYREIEVTHGFYLFWSHHAKASPWVEKEWRYALDRRGLDFINPLALEDPRNVSPPPELSSKHFNDMMLAFIAYEQLSQQK